MSIAVTQGIKVSVKTQYLEEESEPEQHKYFFAYQITIKNEGPQRVQLLTRHWIIKDATNEVEEVEGEGVVGQTPIIAPGDSYTYVSHCPLRTEYGTMRGSYGMVRPNGEAFEATIAPFALLPHYLLN